MRKFQDTLETLKSICAELKQRGIVVEHLNSAIQELQRHQENIAAIEENIRAIQDEVIAPVKSELEFNRASGKFSIFGFWVGAVGLIVSILTIGLSFVRPSVVEKLETMSVAAAPEPELLDKINRIETIVAQLAPPASTTTPSEVATGRREIEEFDKMDIAENGKSKLSMKVMDIKPAGYNDYPKCRAGIAFYRDGREIAKKTLLSTLQKVNRKLEASDWYDDCLVVEAGDSITVDGQRVFVESVLATEPGARSMGDSKSSVVVLLGGSPSQ